MSIPMSRWFAVSLLLACSCDAFLKDNDEYCDGPGKCEMTPGMICDTTLHHCISDSTPRLTGITPWSVKRMGGTTVTLKGQNFKSGMIVQVDGQNITPTSVMGTEIQFPSPMMNKCGATQVKVLDGAQAIAGQVELRYRLSTLSLAQAGASPTVDVNSTSIVAGDFDQDGNGDLAVSSSASPAIIFSLGAGDFTLKSQTTTAIGSSFGGLKAAELNGAAGTDLVAFNGAQVSYFSGPTFASLPNTINAPDLGDCAIGDINNDGRSDLVIIPRNKGPISGYTYNTQTDQFDPTLPNFYMLSDGSTRAVIDDFNNDGFSDVAVGTQPDGLLNLCLGKSKTPSFDCKASALLPGSGAPSRLGSAIVSADGKRLMVIATTLSSSAELFVVGLGPGNILMPTSLGTFGDVPRVMLLDDINCDGLKDIVLYSTRENLLRVHANLGDGTFATTSETLLLNLDLSGSPTDDVFSVAVGDLNGDGVPDVSTLHSKAAGPATVGTLFRNSGN